MPVEDFLREQACAGAIVICDMAMQEDDGAELFASVQAHAPRLKIICISAVQQVVRSNQKLLECEAMAVLEEPFTPAALADAVQKVTNRK